MENNFLFFDENSGDYFYVQEETFHKAQEIVKMYEEENDTTTLYIRCDNNYIADILGYDTF